MKPKTPIQALHGRLVHNHAKGCLCSPCLVLRAWPDRERVLAVTRPWTKGHEATCPCKLCATERLLEKEKAVWEA